MAKFDSHEIAVELQRISECLVGMCGLCSSPNPDPISDQSVILL